MAGPIQGNFTPAQIQELEQIWSTLPNADSKGMQNDLSKLQKLCDSFPPNSQQAQSLNNIIYNLQFGMMGSWAKNAINYAE